MIRKQSSTGKKINTNLFKKEIEYTLHCHPIKAIKYFQIVEQLKRVGYESKTMFVPSTKLKHKTTKTNPKIVVKESKIVKKASLHDKLSCVPIMKSL